MALTKSDSYEKLLEAVERAAWREFDRGPVIDVMGELSDPGFNTHVHSTFQNAVIFEDECSHKLYESTYLLNGDTIIFGPMQEVAEMYVEKRMAELGMEFTRSSKDANYDPEIAGPIVMKSEAQRIAYAAVLVPGEKDSDGEIISAGKIEQVAHGWMESYRNVDLMHTLNNTGFPVESYILPAEMEVEAYGQKMLLPVGTWILASKLSEDAWAGVESGLLTGYSVMGIKKAQLDMATKSEDTVLDETAFKRTLLADLGPDWVAAFVSVVDHPAVPKAKFFALKSKEFSDAATEEASPTFFSKVGKALGLTKTAEDVCESSAELEEAATPVAEKAGRRYSDSTYNALKRCKDAIKDCHDQLDALVQEAEVERQAPDSSEEEDDEEDGGGVAKSEDTSEGPVTDMDEAQLQAIIAEAVKSAVEPLVTRLDEIESASKAEVSEVEAEVVEEVAEKAAEEEVVAVEESAEKAEEAPEVEVPAEVVEKAAAVVDEIVEESVEEVTVEKAEEVIEPSAEDLAETAVAEKAAADKAAEEEVFKSELLDRLDKMEKRLGRVATSSKSLPNDGSGSSVEEVEDTSGRDAFGRRIKV